MATLIVITFVFVIFFIFIISTSGLLEIEIIKARETPQSGIKTEAEAEISFITVQLGFVNDKYLLKNTPIETFIEKYLNYQDGSIAKDLKITKKYFEENKESLLCRAYLSDPIFEENDINFFPINKNNPVQYELKFLYNPYFSRKIEYIKVIRCPVFVKQKETRLYFHEILYSFHFSTPHFRAYFVLQNRHSKIMGRQVLEILMFTNANTVKLPDLDDTDGEEAEIKDYRGLISPVYTIKLNIIATLWENKLRSFGERAELFYTTKTYGFFDLERSYWKMKAFLFIVERLKRGFRIDVDKMNEMRNENKEFACESYLRRSFQLLEKNIVFKKNHGPTEVNWFKKNVKFPKNVNFFSSSSFELLQCPIKFNEDMKIRHIYILPILYSSKNKLPVLFSFQDMVTNPNKVHPLALNTLERENYKLGASFSDFDKEEEQQQQHTTEEDEAEYKIIEAIPESVTYVGSSSAAPSSLEETFST